LWLITTSLVASAILIAAAPHRADALSGVITPSAWYTDTVYSCTNGDGTPDLGNIYAPDGSPLVSGVDPVTMCDSGQYFDLVNYPDAAAWLANFNPAVYGTYHLVQFDAATSVCNSAPDYATCIAGMDYDSDFAFDMINGLTPTSTPSTALGGATSTIEQAQQNLSTAFYIFFIVFFGTVWLLRKH